MPKGKTISELIILLEQAKEQHGDLPVYTFSHAWVCTEPITGIHFDDKPKDGNGREWVEGVGGITLER